MVESIFGGKATYPLGCYERNVFHPRLAERRLSVQSAQLKTISETGDDNNPSGRASPVQVCENTVNEGPSCYRRPRTMSLPAIYRDGSYLRIKRNTNAPISCQKRRYSEPAGMTTQKIIHRLSLRPNDSYSVSDESANASCKRPSVKSEEAACTSRKSSFQDILTPRRHSDPMCFVTEQVKKLQISQERRERSPRKVVPIVTALSVSGQNKPQTQTDTEQTGPRVSTRRRKFSLVPVPFSSPVQDTQKTRLSQATSRPLSFPPSKQESKQHCNLPALNLKSRFLTGHVSSENEDTTIECDCKNNSGRVDEQPLESDDTKDVEDKYIANEAILVQWMKFFG